MQHKQPFEGKKDYEKPVLRVIELAAEEVLSVGCKTGFSDHKGVAGSGCLTGLCSSRTGS
jgi:hypothetical protein